MKNQFVFLAVILSAILLAGCRDAYEIRSELQAQHPEAEVMQIPETRVWLVRLPNGAVLVQDVSSGTPDNTPLSPSQIIGPIREDEFTPEYQAPALEL